MIFGAHLAVETGEMRAKSVRQCSSALGHVIWLAGVSGMQPSGEPGLAAVSVRGCGTRGLRG